MEKKELNEETLGKVSGGGGEAKNQEILNWLARASLMILIQMKKNYPEFDEPAIQFACTLAMEEAKKCSSIEEAKKMYKDVWDIDVDNIN